MNSSKREFAKPSWWSEIALKDWVTIGGTLLTAVSAVFAGLKYVFGAFSDIKLEIELPPLIEFRCSSTNFDAAKCIHASQGDDFHLTITAALFLRAVGDPSKEATITSATATISGPDLPTPAPKLTWIWSGDFIPEQKFQRKQVTADSIRGGQATSREMWFFPLDEPCGERSLDQCRGEGRRNFVSWREFLARTSVVPTSEPRTKARYEITFDFKYREGDKPPDEKGIKCFVEISDTLRKMANMLDGPERHEIPYVSAPCRRIDSPAPPR